LLARRKEKKEKKKRKKRKEKKKKKQMDKRNKGLCFIKPLTYLVWRVMIKAEKNKIRNINPCSQVNIPLDTITSAQTS